LHGVGIDVLRTAPPRRLSPLGALRRRRQRAAADQWLAERTHTFTSDDRIRRRITELTSPHERISLAKSLQGAIRESRRAGVSASPLNRHAVAECATELSELAEHLADLSRPVTPRGVVLTMRLLTDGAGPMYDRERGGLAAEVTRIRDALEDA
jgi:hypothetical protein